MEVWRATQEGLEAVIVQPGIIMGSGSWEGASSKMFDMVTKGIPFYTSGGIGIVDVQDVVKAMVLLMQGQVVNDSFVLVGKNISYRELLTEIAVNLNKKPPNRKVPKWALSIVSILEWTLYFVFGRDQKLPKSAVKSLYKTSSYDSSKIINQVNFSFNLYHDTIVRVARNYLNRT
jgi:nucleoside-diphosphate-sugar epimerase